MKTARLLIMIKLLKWAFVIALFVLSPVTGHARDGQIERIALVVNDDAITFSDLEHRIQMTISSAGLEPSADLQRKILPQVVNELVEESIKMQEAKRLGITVSDEDVNLGFADIASQNNFTPEQFRAILQKNGTDMNSLYEKIRSQIAWSRVIANKIRPQVNITENDIKAVVDTFLKNSGKTEYLLSEIFLPIDSPAKEPEVRELAHKLSSELKKGAPFQAVARQFSASPSVANGGMTGWIREGNFEPELETALQSMPPKQTSDPIRTQKGYYIVHIHDKRRLVASSPLDAEYDIYQLFIADEGKSKSDLKAQADEVAKNLTGCFDYRTKSKQYPSPRTGHVGRLKLRELADDIAPVIRSLDIGQASKPVPQENGYAIYLVCDKNAPNGNMPSEQDIEKQLVLERMDMLQRQYYLDLKSGAFIDNRLDTRR